MTLTTIFWILFILMIVVTIFAFVIQNKFRSNNVLYSSVKNSSGKTGKEVAEAILAKNNITNVRVVMGNEGQDHFDPMKRIISLSPSNYNSASVAAMAIAAHESGHAIQWAKQNFWLKARESLMMPVQIATSIGSTIFSLGLFLLLFFTGSFFIWMTVAGLITYGAMGLFQLVTLPVEFDASKKAIRQLEEMNLISGKEELKGSKTLLRSAAMTYVIAFLMSLVTVLVYVVQFLMLTRDN